MQQFNSRVMKRLISVCGSDSCDKNLSQFALETAEKVGQLIAQHGGVVVCGGRGGIMKAACKGAKSQNGLTIGILPNSKEEANEYIDIPLVTGLGHRRNFLVANAADAIIAIGGRWGTLSEIAYAMVFEKPLILISDTGGCVDEIVKKNIMQNIESNYFVAQSAQEAVTKAFELI
jgi:uncharacterized protein (TIGR00725 family)